MGKDSCSYDDAHKQQRPIKPTPTRANKKPIKITHISSPVTVRARDASEFRDMVQNLTGKNSGTSFICTARKERKVDEVFISHVVHGPGDGASTTLPQSDIALHDTMPSWPFEQQDYSQTQTLESLVQFLPHQ